MVVALNFLVPLIFIAMLLLAMRLKKIWPILVAVAFVIVYQAVQPSYIPKGTTKSLPNADFMVDETEIKDRVRKTMSADERDARMKEAEKETQIRIEELREKSKENKNG